MKNIFCIAVLLGTIYHASAQNTFPTGAGTNVGIGTLSPASPLQVVGDIRFGSNGAYTDLKISTQTPLSGYNQTNAITPLTAPGSGVAKAAFYLKNAGSVGITRMDLLVDGNVGIGTNTPGSSLDISSTLATAGATAFNVVATGSAVNQTYYGGKLNVTHSGTAAGGGVVGLDIVATKSGSNSLYSATGINGIVNTGLRSSGSTAQSFYGTKFIINGSNEASSTASQISYYGNYSEVNNSTAVGEISNSYGVYGKATSMASGTAYGGYFTASGGTNSYGVYSAAGTNYFNGNVGIGTTTPAGKLQVMMGNGSDLLANNNSVDIGVNGTSSGWARAFRIVNTSGSNGLDGGAFGVRGTDSIPNYIYMAIPTAEPLGYASTKIMVLNNLGNVGIGTITPGLKAHIAGAIGFPATTGTVQTGVLRLQGLTSNAVLDFGVNGSSGAYLQVTNQTALTANYPLLLNPNGGNVGIGTTDTKGYKFAVNGSVVATSVTVKLNSAWPDYVFKKDYKLPTLTEVKDYIDKNQHLPDMPSEKEVADNGLNLGEMNKNLTKKVEELTLYLIEQNKEMKALKERVSELEKRK